MIGRMLQGSVVALVLFGLYGSALAADNHWLGSAGDNEWGNVANWEDGHVPDAVLWPAEEAEVGYTTVGAGPILGAGDVGSAYRIFLGQNDGESMYGELTMDGGTLTTSGYMSTAYHTGTSALITMNSGSVYIGDPAGSNGHLYLGRAGSAILNMNGGLFVLDDSLQIGKNAGGYGEVNLAGGTLQLSSIAVGAGSGLIDITGGTLLLNGDSTAAVDGFIASGLIVGYAGTGTLHVVYEDGVTTVTAVSEQTPVAPPTSLALTGEHITATASSAYSVDEGPAKTIDGSGLNSSDLHSIDPTAMWISDVDAEDESTWIQYEFDTLYLLDQMLVWNHNTMCEHLVGFGIKEATVEYSLDGDTWMSLGEYQEFPRASGEADAASNATLDFGGVSARVVRITALSNWGGLINLFGLSEVRFMVLPLRAHTPDPVSGAEALDSQLTLTWTPGRRVALHDVYLSANEQSVIDGTAPVITATEASYGPLSLELGQTYYWRVDEVNEADDPAVWQGEVWHFLTTNFLPIDNFETYTDLEGNRIYEIWLDGYTNKSGSIVGHADAPFAEQTVVRSGSQSMPILYDNAVSPWYSEADRTWDTPQDWTARGADAITLSILSDPNNQPTPLYIAVQDNDGLLKGVPLLQDDAIMEVDGWQTWRIALSEFSEAGLMMTQVKTLSIAVGDRANPTMGGSGTIYVDDIALVRTVNPEP